MQTTEIIVYFIIAVMLGGLVIGFITGFDYFGLYDKVKSAMFDENEEGFEKVDLSELGIKVFEVAEKCSSEENYKRLVHVSSKTASEINLEAVFKPIIKFNLCYSVQSQSQNCGNGVREDVRIEDELDGEITNLPTLVEISCDDDQNLINISSV
jgi:hypothetical protein